MLSTFKRSENPQAGQWLRCYWQNRNAMVVFPKMGSTVVFKHHRRSASGGRWFRLYRYRGVATFPLGGLFCERSG